MARVNPCLSAKYQGPRSGPSVFMDRQALVRTRRFDKTAGLPWLRVALLKIEVTTPEFATQLTVVNTAILLIPLNVHGIFLYYWSIP